MSPIAKKTPFSWDNTATDYSEACYSVFSDIESLHEAGSHLILLANNFPDPGALNFIGRPLYHIDDEVRERFINVGLALLSASLCDRIEVVLGCNIGDIRMTLADEIPDGCLPLDGSFHLRSDYPDLWDALPDTLSGNQVRWEQATPYDGQGFLPLDDYIFLPNAAGIFMRGAGVYRGAAGVWSPSGAIKGVYGAGEAGGEEDHTLTVDEIPAHEHALYRSAFNIQSGTGQNDVGQNDGSGTSAISTTVSTGGGQAHNNMPPFLTIKFYIVAICPSGESLMDNFRLRQDPTNDCMLQQSITNGGSWIDAFDFSLCQPQPTELDNTDLFTRILDAIGDLGDNYDGTPQSINPNLVYGDSDDDNRDSALCFALYLFVNTIIEITKQAQEDEAAGISSSLSSLGSAAGGLGAIYAALAAAEFVNPLFAVAFAGIQVATSLLAVVTEHNLPDLDFSSDQIEDVVCHMYGNMAGSDPTFGSFYMCMNGFSNPDDKTQALSEMMYAATHHKKGYLTFIELLGQVVAEAIAGSTFYCPCTAPLYCPQYPLDGDEIDDSVTPYPADNEWYANNGIANPNPGVNSAALWTSPAGIIQLSTASMYFQSTTTGQTAFIQYWDGANWVTLKQEDFDTPGDHVMTWTDTAVITERVRFVYETNLTLHPGKYIYKVGVCYQI